MEKNVTIKDIAAALGYSTATVSRVLSGTNYPVNATVRARIEEYAEQAGYSPNRFARSLRTDTSNEVAVVIPSFRNPFYMDALTGIEAELTNAGYELVFYIRKRQSINADAFIKNILSKRMSGLIIASDCISNEFAKILVEYQKTEALVILDGEIPGYEILNGVFFDYKKGAKKAVEYLIRNGHKEAALITKRQDIPTRISITEGYLAAYEAAGFAKGEEDIFVSNLDDDFSAGVELAEALLDSGKPYTALLANNDSVAAGTLSALIRMGVRVPEEISIIGIDDNIFSRTAIPLLTTVRVPSREMGAYAAKIILEKLENNNMLNKSVYMDPEIIIRNTVINRNS